MMQIVQAARSLFIAHGYAATTIESIAQASGVAKETIYSMFKNKLTILDVLLDVAIGGDDQPVRVIDRGEQQDILQTTDQRQQLSMLAERIADIVGRAAPVFEVMRMAAKSEPKINGRMRHLQQERRDNMIQLMRQIATNGPFRNELDATRAGETVWALASPELFTLLTTELGWSRETYRTWLADTLIRSLLPEQRGQP